MLVELTYACSMGCTHCMSDCKPNGEHMPVKVVEDTLDFMVKNRIPTWSFSGWGCLNIQIFWKFLN